MAKTQLGRDLKDDETKDIVAFLKSLNGTLPKQTLPKLPPGKDEKKGKKAANASKEEPKQASL